MLIDAGVTDDLHLVDRSRFTFVHAHLKVDGVVGHIHLDGFNVEEEVTAIGVQFAHGIVVIGQTVIERLEVIDVTRLYTSSGIQHLVRIDGVSYPFNRTNVVLVAFADGHVDVHTIRIFGVRHN